MSLATAAPPRPAPTAGYLLDALLPELLAELGVVVHVSSITDREFLGAVVVRRDGRLVLSMPTGRSELEHDTMARYLLAQAFDVDLPKLPSPFLTAEL